ncbi:MAG: poly-gamma-glutamate synthase PgsB [Armatimonadota bacterium]|nr:poly-gamma-glutamate synthase PgsB [Armatimonadota bacterium]
MDLAGLLPVVAAGVAAAAEARRHWACLRSIRHRIHVNGTRGKSSVVRLIAAGLRVGGLRVVAKTTGSAPRVILPDGSERDLRGRRRASLLEYRSAAALAARLRADALVAECMALRPESQRVAEHCLMRSTVGVLTGVGLDHVGIMGDSLAEIAEVLGRTIPAGGLLLVPGPEVPPVWLARARAQGTVVRVVQVESGVVMPEAYREWPENVALALAACEAVGVSREAALSGIRTASPDPGALRIWRLREPGRQTWLVGAFGANDPHSSRRIIERVRRESGLADAPVIAVFNTRADRGERTLQWCEALLAGAVPASRVIVTGPHAPAAVRVLVRGGWSRQDAAALPPRPAAITAAAVAQHGATIVAGLGNVRGAGAALLDYWATVAEEIVRG